MGATNFLEFREAATAREAYRLACEDAACEFGRDPYNGTVSTTDFHSVVGKVADAWGDGIAEKAAKTAGEQFGWGEKWECRALDCGETEGGGRMWALFGWAAC